MGAIISTLVSIITVSFNSEATIKDTIESVLFQSYSNIEYFIIDGKSIDKTVAIAESYKDKFLEKGIKYTIISEKDQGIYHAMNKGVNLASGKIVGIINSDDWYELDAIEKVVNRYKKTNFDMLYADLRLIKPNWSMIKKAKMSFFITSRYWNHPTTFISKEVYTRFQYKLESIHDDFDLMLKIRNNYTKIVILNEVLANFRVGGISNQKSLPKCYNRIKARYKIYRNNGYSRLYLVECLAIELAKFILA